MTTRSRKSKTVKESEASREEVVIADSEDEEGSSSVKRTVTTRTVASEKPWAASTPQTSASQTSSSRSYRSTSPLTIQRAEEKEELAHLNDRLASYIDYVRSLETTKEKLTKKIKSMSRTEVTEIDKLKDTYEDELRSLRKMVDDLAKDRANLEIELKNAKDDATTYRKKFERRDLDVTNLERKIEMLERELSKQKADAERYTTILTQCDALEKRCAKLSKDLDAEVLLRTDIENRNVTLKEQLEFNDKIFSEERLKMKQSQVVIEEEIEDRKKVEYESKLADELRAIREETALEFESYKLEFEDAFTARLDELKKSNQLSAQGVLKTKDELMSWRSRSEKFEQELASKNAEIDVLSKRVKDLEALLTFERRDFEEQLKRMRDESDKLKSDLQTKLEELSQLMSAKIALDQEILMYRKLLESEESRCNITVRAGGDTSFATLSAAPASKRRRVGEKSEFLTDDSNLGGIVSYGREIFKVETTSKGDIEFSEKPDCTGKCVKLFNKSDKDICIGGWILNYKADNMETSYKFHHNLHVKAKSDCTVWSSDANETHNPPTDIVMKGQRFFTGSSIAISLVNSDEEQASCKIVKDSTRSSAYNYNRKVASRTVRSEDSKCSMM